MLSKYNFKMQPSIMLPKLANSKQTITFSEGDGVSSSEVFASDVVVSTTAGSHNHGSSKVKLKSLVDYNWEPKFYPGQLLAVHISGKYLAYSIKAPNAANPGTWNGMVRVVYNPEPDIDRRTLIKGMKGEVQDLAFAHIQNQVVLACIDELGNFYIHEIENTDSGLRTTLILEVREDTGAGGCTHRVVWCPYIPDEDDDAADDDAAKLLLTTHAHIARMWNVRSLVSRARAGAGCSLGAGAALAAGGRAAGEHAAPLLAAAFSPDGSALATAAADGYVMFFQVYMNNESSPRCLHKWQPHGGQPLSSLFFLDNHKNYNTDVQFWKFAVTGAENNTSIKVWSCKSWNCLQSISFSPSLGGDASLLGMKAALDTSAAYLLLSDYKARSLYVLHMARDAEDSTAYCKSISEFLLPYPVLSFCIVDAEEIQAKCESACDDPFHQNGADGSADESPDEFDLQHDVRAAPSSTAVRLRLYFVQPKGLQEGELLYEPPAPQPLLAHPLPALEAIANEEPAQAPVASSILQQQSQQLKNLLMRSQTQPGSLIGQRPDSPPAAPPALNLMTPDAFSSPGKREEEDPPLSATPDVGASQRASVSGEEAAGETKPPSGGSSPSREVQQIMAHDQGDYYKEMEDEEEEEEEAAQGSRGVQASSAPAEALYPPERYAPATPYAPSPTTPYEPSPVAPLPALVPLAHASSETSWPQISMAQINEANIRKATSDKACQSQSAPPPAPLPAPPAPAPPERAAVDEATRAKIETLEQKLDKLTEMMSAQTRELRALRGETAAPRELLAEALDAHSERTTTAIEAALTDGWERIARMSETASSAAAQAAGKGAARALEPLATALQHELATKLTATDRLLRENIEKLANSKSVTEKLSTAIAQSLADMVRESLRNALLENVLPLMEKTLDEAFTQINQAFQEGTKDFVENTETAAHVAAERGAALAVASLHAALDQHMEALACAGPPAPQAYGAALKEVAHNVLEKELAWWREQARSVVQLSRAHSPATPVAMSVADRQLQVNQIQSLVSGGDMNGAFQLALSASDLALVVAACRACEPTRVFGPPCRLKQHVLLSLVQQLAADMTRDTQLKYRYLEEAIMNLDTNNPVTREHLPSVVRELQKQLVAFLGTHPGHPLTRQFRMLLMATEALVKGSM